jgi:hypothetical protein
LIHGKKIIEQKNMGQKIHSHSLKKIHSVQHNNTIPFGSHNEGIEEDKK